MQQVQDRVTSTTIRAALGQIKLTLPPSGTPAPAANPLAMPSKPAPTASPTVPAGDGSEKPHAADGGDIMDAILAVPAIEAAVDSLKTQASDRIMQDWQRLKTGEKILGVSSVIAVAGGALAGVIANPAARKLALDQLNGKVLPVPKLDWLHLEINTGGDNLMLGLHVDVGQLLPTSWGFKASSPDAIGGVPEPEPFPVQRKLDSTEDTLRNSDLESRLNSSKGSGSPLTNEIRGFMEPRFGADFSSVRVHTGTDAVQMNRDVNAQAFAHGQDVYFGAGKRPGKDALTAHELTHVVQQSFVPTYQARSIQRREISSIDYFVNPSEILSDRNWTESDRKNNTQRWHDACLANLKAADSSQYVKVVERRDFYKWFYEYTAALGYTTRWALAAYIVANGAHQIVDMDEEHSFANETLNMANVELQGAMREGNQVIFDNVLPKLKKLFDGGPLKGKSALESDMTMLAEEQSLIQPMYSQMSQDTVDQLNYIARKKRFAGWGASLTDEDKVPKGKYNNAGTVPGFNQPNIKNIGDRWTYGMNLGNQFTPGGSGFLPGSHSMPTVESSYTDGSEFSKVDSRANLHKLDALLNPSRMSRSRDYPGRDIEPIIKSLTPFEKQQVLRDDSPDGWSYSLQFAQLRGISESIVKQALPPDRGSEQAITEFLSRYKKEVQRLGFKYPSPTWLNIL
jgi:hypothetical protein